MYVAHCFLRKSCVLECGDAKERRYASLLLLVEFVAILLLYRGLLMSCFLFRVKTRADCAGMLRFSFILFFVVHAFALLSSWVFATLVCFLRVKAGGDAAVCLFCFL